MHPHSIDIITAFLFCYNRSRNVARDVRLPCFGRQIRRLLLLPSEFTQANLWSKALQLSWNTVKLTSESKQGGKGWTIPSCRDHQ
jgi:hypothetical protein